VTIELYTIGILSFFTLLIGVSGYAGYRIGRAGINEKEARLQRLILVARGLREALEKERAAELERARNGRADRVRLRRIDDALSIDELLQLHSDSAGEETDTVAVSELENPDQTTA